MHRRCQARPRAGGHTLTCAHNFVRNPARFDPTAHLVLWQINMIYAVTEKEHPAGIAMLAKLLAQIYGTEHKVILYHASEGVTRTTIKGVTLAKLPEASINTGHSLYVPPVVRWQW